MAAIFKRCKHTDKARCKCNWVVKWRTPDGRQREKSYLWNQKQLANDHAVKVEHDKRAGVFVDTAQANELFTVAATRWIERLAATESTKEAYRRIYRGHIGPVLGGRRLHQVAQARDDVTDLLNVTMGDLSRSTREHARSIITATLDEAVNSGRLPRHRCGGIKLSPGNHIPQRTDFVFPSHAQLQIVAERLGDLELTIWLMRGVGVRIQEALAVKRENFMADGTMLRITEQATRDGRGTMHLKQRKPGEHRDMPVPSYLWDMVKDLPDGYLFQRPNGKLPLYKTYLLRFWDARQQAGIAEGFTPHSLRHAFATALLARGVQITDVARWLGHRDISLTFGTYSHFLPSAWDKARDALDDEYEQWKT